MKKLVVFSGAGISAESGIQTFRDSGGLWEEHRIEDVATPEAFHRNPKLVLDFYNMRRKRIGMVEPNQAHLSIVDLEKHFHVTVVTQNIDNLHERAGSKNVVHLHGEITKAKPSMGYGNSIDIGYENIELGDLAENGSQLRPDIVWFGEAVPNYDIGLEIIQACDVLIVVGTSLNVYPAAGLIHYAPDHASRFVVDPGLSASDVGNGFEVIQKDAGIGLPDLVRQLIQE